MVRYYSGGEAIFSNIVWIAYGFNMLVIHIPQIKQGNQEKQPLNFFFAHGFIG
jgi:hypothetical protein